MFTQPMKILNFLILPCKKLANQKWISSKCEYLSKINQGSRPTRVSTGFLLFTLFLQVTHSLQVKKCQISQRNCQIKFKFGSKEAKITILKSSSLETPCSELRQTQSWCIQDPGKIDKKDFQNRARKQIHSLSDISTVPQWSLLTSSHWATRILWAQIWSLKNPLTLRSDSEDGFILNERGLAHLPVRTQNLANLADTNSKLGESCRYELKTWRILPIGTQEWRTCQCEQ